MNVLKSAAQKAGKPRLLQRWTLQMECNSSSEYTVVYGWLDEQTGREEGMRITAVPDRSVWTDGVKVTVVQF